MELSPQLTPLREALQRRMEIIADHAWRDADPAAHLDALKSISESIFAMQASLREHMPPRLRHFMESQSYQKALDLLQG